MQYLEEMMYEAIESLSIDEALVDQDKFKNIENRYSEEQNVLSITFMKNS